MKDPLLTLKTKNLLKKAEKSLGANMDLEFHLSLKKEGNHKRGCLGFVLNRKNNKVVFVSTTFSEKVLYKGARHLKDYKGGCSRWASRDDFAMQVIGLLK